MLARYMKLDNVFEEQNEKSNFLADTSWNEDTYEVLHTHDYSRCTNTYSPRHASTAY